MGVGAWLDSRSLSVLQHVLYGKKWIPEVDSAQLTPDNHFVALGPLLPRLSNALLDFP